MDTGRIFIGYDPCETVAYHVLCNSLMRHSSRPLAITPIMMSQLGDIITRPRHPAQSNDFAFIRWLTPWLSDYKGVSLFMDCDMLVVRDIMEVFRLAETFCDKGPWSVACCQQTHPPKEEFKFLGRKQTAYERKNWSSFMLFNNAECRALTPEYINTAAGLDLHQFRWTEDDKLREIPVEWNYLVGVTERPFTSKVANLHYTLGGPWFREYVRAPHAWRWMEEYKRATKVDLY